MNLSFVDFKREEGMVGRRDLKNVHENSVLEAFKKHVSDSGNSLEIIEMPDPPEAFVKLNASRTWIEITDAYLDLDHAIGLTTWASDDAKHISDSKRLIVEPDATFQAVLLSVVEKKYKKATMFSIFNEEGPGILLVGVFTPFSSAYDIACEQKENIRSLVEKESTPIFSTIYVYDGVGKREFHKIYQKT